MNRSATFLVVLALALPVSVHAQERMTEEQLIIFATERGVCDDRDVVSARYVNDTDNRVQVTCEDDEGILAARGGLGSGAGGVAAAALGLLLVAAAAGGGGGGSTPDTQ